MSFESKLNNNVFTPSQINDFPFLQQTAKEVDKRAQIGQEILNSLAQGDSKELENRLYNSSIATIYESGIALVGVPVFMIHGLIMGDELAYGVAAGLAISLLAKAIFHDPRTLVRDYEAHQTILNARHWVRMNECLKNGNYGKFQQLSKELHTFITAEHNDEQRTLLKAQALAPILDDQYTRKQIKKSCKKFLKAGVDPQDIENFKERFIRKLQATEQAARPIIEQISTPVTEVVETVFGEKSPNFLKLSEQMVSSEQFSETHLLDPITDEA